MDVAMVALRVVGHQDPLVRKEAIDALDVVLGESVAAEAAADVGQGGPPCDPLPSGLSLRVEDRVG